LATFGFHQEPLDCRCSSASQAVIQELAYSFATVLGSLMDEAILLKFRSAFPSRSKDFWASFGVFGQEADPTRFLGKAWDVGRATSLTTGYFVTTFPRFFQAHRSTKPTTHFPKGFEQKYLLYDVAASGTQVPEICWIFGIHFASDPSHSPNRSSLGR
jgi:hypothetical protein